MHKSRIMRKAVTLKSQGIPQPAVPTINSCPSGKELALPVFELDREKRMCRIPRCVAEKPKGQLRKTVPPAGPLEEPLFRAIREGNLAKAEAAIRNGANVNTKDERGERPIDVAFRRNNLEIHALILKYTAKTGTNQ